jgi:tetratricopeptide (TPR) repeat protein
VEPSPTSARSIAEQLDSLRISRDFSEAEEIGHRALVDGFAVPAIRIALGRIKLLRNCQDEALRYFEDAIRDDPTSGIAVAWKIATLCRLRRFDDAEKAGVNALGRFPSHVDILIAIGRLQLDRNTCEKAASWFQNAFAVDPRNSTVLKWRVTALRRLRRFEEAESAARAAIDTLPHEPDLLVERGWVHGDQDNYGAALEWFNKALKIDDRHAWALRSRINILRRLRRFKEAESAARAAIDTLPHEPALPVQLGFVCNDQADYEAALKWFNKALQIDPRNSTALEWRVTALRSLRRFKEAESAARAAIDTLPHEPALPVQLGWVHGYQANYEAALEWFNKALKIDDRHAWALRSRINILRRLRRFNEAESAARAAIDTLCHEPDLPIQLGFVYSDQADYEAALEWFDKALQIDPRNSTALEWRVTALRSLRRFKEAESSARAAIDTLPHEPDLLVERGWVHGDQDNYGAALEWFNKALKIDDRHAWALRSRINILRRLRRFKEAESAARAAIDTLPHEPALPVQLGFVYNDQADYEAALEWFNKALQIDPRNSTALNLRVTALRSLRRFKEAESAARAAIDTLPHEPALPVQLGFVCNDQADYEAALEWFNKALQIDPRNSTALEWRVTALRRLRRFEEAESAARAAIDTLPHEPALLVGLGWVHGDQANYKAALEWFNKALKIDDRHAWALRSRINILRRLRRFNEAESAARAAIDTLCHEPDLPVQLGFVYDEQADYEAALEWFDKALQIDPRNSTALEWRVTALRSLRRFKEAESSARAAIDTLPHEPALPVQLGWVHGYQANYEAALEWFNKALQIDPRNSTALKWRVTALRSLRRFEEAESAARAAIDTLPHEPALPVQLGFVYDDQADYEAALEWFDKALQIDPRNSTALEWRVTALRSLRRFEEAESAARAAIDTLPHEPALLVQLGFVYDDQANYEAALKWFDKALEIEPRDENTIKAKAVTLRSTRRFDDAERILVHAIKVLPYEPRLRAELGWVHHDVRDLDRATRIFKSLLDDSIGPKERAESLRALGWMKFAKQDYKAAEILFHNAHNLRPAETQHKLGIAWCLARQESNGGWRDAEELCFSILDEDPANHSAHTCLGVLNYQYGRYAQAEHHLKKAAVLDSRHDSYVDLGALYSQLDRFDEADSYLQKALAGDWYDIQAHIELGHLYLRRNIQENSGEYRTAAIHHFRQARKIDPVRGSAVIGLALALSQPPGDLVESEAILQEALSRRDCDLPRWRLLIAVARLLVSRGDTTQVRQFYLDALAHTQEAIALAAEKSEPYFVAAIARYKLADLTGDFSLKPVYRRMAVHDLRRAVKLDPGNIEAQRSLRIVDESLRIRRNSTTGSMLVVTIGTLGLTALWAAFFSSGKVTPVMLMTLTPSLIALVVVGLLLPFVIRLKLPGVEADLSTSIRQVSSGPTGDETFGPGKFSASVSSDGPIGQIRRFE